MGRCRALGVTFPRSFYENPPMWIHKEVVLMFHELLCRCGVAWSAFPVDACLKRECVYDGQTETESICCFLFVFLFRLFSFCVFADGARRILVVL